MSTLTPVMAAILSPGVTPHRPWGFATNTFMTLLLIEFVTIKTEFIDRNDGVMTIRLLALMRTNKWLHAVLFSGSSSLSPRP